MEINRKGEESKGKGSLKSLKKNSELNRDAGKDMEEERDIWKMAKRNRD